VLPENSDPQKMGSTITYFRRYALQSLFLLQAEDDDGHSAVDRTLMNNPASKREYPKTAKPTYDSNSKEAKIWIDIPFEGVADLKALKLEWAKWNPDRGQWSCFDSPENRSKLKGLQQVKALKTDSGEEITL
jgi:hypothetical protein